MLNRKYFNQEKAREVLFLDFIELSAYIQFPYMVDWLKYNTQNFKQYYKADKLIIKKVIR